MYLCVATPRFVQARWTKDAGLVSVMTAFVVCGGFDWVGRIHMVWFLEMGFKGNLRECG